MLTEALPSNNSNTACNLEAQVPRLSNIIQYPQSEWDVLQIFWSSSPGRPGAPNSTKSTDPFGPFIQSTERRTTMCFSMFFLCPTSPVSVSPRSCCRETAKGLACERRTITGKSLGCTRRARGRCDAHEVGASDRRWETIDIRFVCGCCWPFEPPCVKMEQRF